jgi:hypothetical protein
MEASAEVATWFSATTPRSVSSSVSWQAGDLVIVHGLASDESTELGTPTVSGLTFTLVSGTGTASASQGRSYIWEATAASSGSGTVEGTRIAGSFHWGICVEVWRNSDGIGTIAVNNSATKTVSVARSDAKSGVSYGAVDWDASSAAATWTPTGETVIESNGDNANYAQHIAWWADQGAAGTTSYGISSASGGTFNKSAVEILGSFGGGAIDLVIANLSQAQTLEAFAITQDHTLVVNNLSQAETLEALTFTQTHELIIAALSQAQALDNLTVDSSTNLVIADLTQAQMLDNLVLTQIHQLVIAALTQAQTLDNLALTQVHQLVIAALSQAQTLGNVTLTQVHQLVIAALTQAQALDNLVVNSADNLIIANLTQAQNIDGLTLTQIHQLVIDSLTQAQNIDGLTLAQVHQLVIAALTQTQTLDNVTLTQLHQLVIADLTQEQTLTNLVVVPGGPAPTLRPTIDVVAVALIRLLSAIPASRVDTTLPKDTAVWSDGFVQAVGVSEQSGMYVPLHVSVISVSCWATNIGSGKPPWGKANQLSEIIKVACLDHSNFPVTLDLSTLGDYGPARVHSAYFITEPHRIPSDEGSYARYDGDLQIHWTPL